MSMFGLVIPGRPVETNFQQVEASKFLITLPNADSINHVVLFLTGLVQLPADIAGCIYFSLPDPNAPPTWNYLGFLTNEKPSAIYKLTNLTQSNNRTNGEVMQSSSTLGKMDFNYSQAPVIHVAQIGISLEPLSAVSHMVPATETAASKANAFMEFINKTATNLFNYCSSFSRPANELTTMSPFSGSCSTQYVPMTTIQNWYENYTRRLSVDQNFWKTLN